MVLTLPRGIWRACWKSGCSLGPQLWLTFPAARASPSSPRAAPLTSAAFATAWAAAAPWS